VPSDAHWANRQILKTAVLFVLAMPVAMFGCQCTLWFGGASGSEGCCQLRYQDTSVDAINPQLLFSLFLSSLNLI
jgi:hypothetical protein